MPFNDHCFILCFSISIFEVQYKLTVDEVQLKATLTTPISAEVIASNIANVTNPQGISYEVYNL